MSSFIQAILLTKLALDISMIVAICTKSKKMDLLTDGIDGGPFHFLHRKEHFSRPKSYMLQVAEEQKKPRRKR